MKKYILTILLLQCFVLATQSQNVGIGTTTPNTSAALEIKSDSSGILIPRLSTTQMQTINNPAEGLMIFNNTKNQYMVFKSGEWTSLTPVPNGAILLTDNLPNYNSDFKKQGFTQYGYLPLTYTSQIIKDSTIPAFTWYDSKVDKLASPFVSGSVNYIGSIKGYNNDSLLFVFESYEGTAPPYGYYTTVSTYSHHTDQWNLVDQNGPNTKFDSIINYVVQGGSIVWSGNQFIFWGGERTGNFTNNGAKYTPATNSWDAVTNTGAPAARRNHKAIWNGTEMIIWGGRTTTNNYFKNGAAYNPLTNTWGINLQTQGGGGFIGRENFSMAATNNKLYLWGGSRSQSKTITIADPCQTLCGGASTVSVTYDTLNTLQDGISFDLTNGTNTPMPIANAPSARYNASCMIINNDLYVVGGSTPLASIFGCNFSLIDGCKRYEVKEDSSLKTGAKLNLLTNTWSSLPDAPVAFTDAKALWDSNHLLTFFSIPALQSFDTNIQQWSSAVFPTLNLPSDYSKTLDVWRTGAYDATTRISSLIYYHSNGKIYNLKTTPVPFSYQSSATSVTTRFYLYKKE